MTLALASSPASGSGPGACALLTNAEVTQAFGEKIADRSSGQHGSSCTWTGIPLGNFTSAHPQLNLTLAGPISKTRFLSAFKTQIVAGSMPGRMERRPALPVTGVGQLAFAMLSGQELATWSHGTVITISTAYVSTPLATAKKLARAAIARL